MTHFYPSNINPEQGEVRQSNGRKEKTSFIIVDAQSLLDKVSPKEPDEPKINYLFF